VPNGTADLSYLQTLASLSEGEVEAVLEQFSPDVEFVFVGESPLGSHLHSRDAVRAWFGRLFRLLPEAHFQADEVLVDGWPWRLRIAARVRITSTVAGEPYENEFCQFLRFRWGKVRWDYILENTQRFERACRRLAAAGLEEAAAPPISDRASAGRSDAGT
jgi:ketosteroid isomerase-like protein